MARPITGNLTFREGEWKIRVRIPTKGIDEYLPTETADKGLARSRQPSLVERFLAKLAGTEPGKKVIVPTITMTEVATDHYDKRKEQGVKSWRDERGRWDQAIRQYLGDFQPKNVRTADVDRVLIEAKKAAYSEESTRKIWQECFRLLKEARKQGLVAENVADAELVTFPRFAKDHRKRQQPTDAEFLKYVAHPDALEYSRVENEQRRARGQDELVSREVKTMAIISRSIGGCRTSDLHALDWAAMDVGVFSVVEVVRPKVDKDPKVYEIEPAVRPYVERWWRDHGCPTKGPVFPTRSNGGRPRADGSAKTGRKTKASYASPFRRDLVASGVTRHELHEDTERTRRCDFHTLRRMYVSALHTAGVGMRESMDLADHGSESTHRKYDTLNRGPMKAPAGVVPQLPPINTAGLGPDAVLKTGVCTTPGTTGISVIGAESTRVGAQPGGTTLCPCEPALPVCSFDFQYFVSGADGTRTRGLRRDRPAL